MCNTYKYGWLFLCCMVVFYTGCANSPDENYNTALDLLENNQPDLAEDNLVEAVQSTPKNSEAWNQLGIISFERGDLEEAKERFKKAAKLHPLNATYQRNIAIVYAEQKEFDVAILLLNKAVELNPLDASNFIVLSKIEWLNNQKKNAVNAIQLALKLDPANTEAQELSSWMTNNPQ